MLNQCCDHPVVELDFIDDRLGPILREFSCDQKWYRFEGKLSQDIISVYDLESEVIRLDATTSYGYWGITKDGLFQLGKGKDHRDDLPQVKIMLSTMDSALPLVTTIVSGNRADDPLYIPAVKRVRNSLQKRGLLYVGDSKMAAIKTRAFIAAGKDIYLCPLPKKHITQEEIDSNLEPVWAGTQELTKIYATDDDGELLVDDNKKPIQIVEGFEKKLS